MEKLNQCPCCLSDHLSAHGKLKDYYVSQEVFGISKCQFCGFEFTNPRPDMQEIGKYYQSANYMSHNTGNTSVFHRLYRLVRNYMYNKKWKNMQQHINTDKKHISLLDYGAASGDFLSYCTSIGIEQTTGIEQDAACRKAAKDTYGFDLKPETELSHLMPAQYDVITLWHVLEHVHTLEETILSFHQLLKKKGVLVISVPNVHSKDREIYQEYWSAYDVPRHLYHFNTETITTLMNRLGFQLSGNYPLIFDAYYISLHSEWYKKTNRLLSIVKAVINGFLSNRAAAKTGNYSSVMYVFTKK